MRMVTPYAAQRLLLEIFEEYEIFLGYVSERFSKGYDDLTLFSRCKIIATRRPIRHLVKLPTREKDDEKRHTVLPL